MVNEPEFFFFFFFGPVDCHECSRGWGDGGARDCERGPQMKTWRREAICLSVQVLNISVLLYTVYLSFNAHSVTHSAII